MPICEFGSAVVDALAKLPSGGSDISPSPAVEPSPQPKITCSYCAKEKPPFIPHGNWCRSIFNRVGILVKLPICGGCAHQLKSGKIIVELSETDMLTKALMESIKRRAHVLSVSGGSLDDLGKLIKELEESGDSFLRAKNDFDQKSLAAATAGAKVEWIRKWIADAREVIERKTKTTYEACRRIADRAITNPSTRRIVFERAEFRCEKCGSEDFLSVDHVISVKSGGANTLENYQCLCLSCNSRKGANG